MIRTVLLAVALIASTVPVAAAGPGSDAPKVQRPRPGDTPPDALGTDDDGNPVTVGQHRGKILIVTFWASWCGPCRRELPMLAHLQKTVGRDALEVIAINLDEPRRDYVEIVRANRRNFDLRYLHDKGAVAEAYGVTGIPNMVIIGTDGIVEHAHVGYSEEMLPRFMEEIIALLPPDVLSRKAGS